MRTAYIDGQNIPSVGDSSKISGDQDNASLNRCQAILTKKAPSQNKRAADKATAQRPKNEIIIAASTFHGKSQPRQSSGRIASTKPDIKTLIFSEQSEMEI